VLLHFVRLSNESYIDKEVDFYISLLYILIIRLAMAMAYSQQWALLLFLLLPRVQNN
jgi:hypothetical protein